MVLSALDRIMLLRADEQMDQVRRKRFDECGVPECGRPSYAKGVCKSHYRLRGTNRAFAPLRRYRRI